VEVIGSLRVGSGARVEEACIAATGLAAGLARVCLALGLEGGGLAVGFAELDGGVLAGEAEVIAGVVVMCWQWPWLQWQGRRLGQWL